MYKQFTAAEEGVLDTGFEFMFLAKYQNLIYNDRVVFLSH